jgi:hypothetical protein
LTSVPPFHRAFIRFGCARTSKLSYELPICTYFFEFGPANVEILKNGPANVEVFVLLFLS